MSLDPALVKIHEALEEYTKSGALDKVGNELPAATAGPSDQSGPIVMSRTDRLALRKEMMTKSNAELLAMFADQAMRQDVGVPVGTWLGAQNDAYFAALQNRPEGALVLKAADTGSASALIRQDLEPILYPLFVRNFPAWDRLMKVPANGLVHSWNKITSFGDATFMSELGTVTDDQNVYENATTNIGVLARRVGVSFKSQFAVQQGGAGYNLESEELTGGLRAMAHKLQKTIFQGNSSASGGTATSEDGLYDANAFTGLRSLLTAKDTDIDISDATFADKDSITMGVNDAVVSPINNGGSPSVVYIRADEHNVWNKQQLEIVRIMDKIEFIPGIRVNAVATSAGDLPLVPIPGDSIGHYTNSANSKDSADLYAVDEGSISLPYLGSDSIQVLDIPVGVGGQLVHYYILWIMVGLALKTDLWSAKVRMQLAA